MAVELKLVPDLIPKTSFYKNLRSILKSVEWNVIRRAVYARAGNRCEVCGSGTRRLECHESWEYDEKTGVQKLVGFVGLCDACHEVKHIGLAYIRGRAKQAMEHMRQVNNIDMDTVNLVVEEAFKIWRLRSKKKWILDVSGLNLLIPKS